MSSPVRKAVIRRISDRRRVSLAVAAYIYACKSINEKQRLCEQEKRMQELMNEQEAGRVRQLAARSFS